jgi:X-X-X-Leu-X-X-Gly heptad repeat protein
LAKNSPHFNFNILRFHDRRRYCIANIQYNIFTSQECDIGENFIETTGFREKIVQLHEKIIQLHEKIAQLHEKIAQLHEKVTQLHEKVTQLHEKAMYRHSYIRKLKIINE